MTLLDFERLIPILFESMAFCAGIATWKRYRHSILQKMTVYLGFIVLAEITGYLLMRYKFKMENSFLFSYIVIPVEFLFWFWFFYKTFEKKGQKKIALLSIVLLFCSMLYEQFFISPGDKFYFMSLSYSLCNILLLLLIILYLVDFVKSDQILYFKRSPVFWIAIGLLLFYLGTFPLFAMFHYLLAINRHLVNVYWHIVVILNCSMYSLFSIAFLWGKRTLTYSS